MNLSAKNVFFLVEAKYSCSICGLHYTKKELADMCHMWCSKHDSCNLSVASKSIEAMARRKNVK